MNLLLNILYEIHFSSLYVLSIFLYYYSIY